MINKVIFYDGFMEDIKNKIQTTIEIDNHPCFVFDANAGYSNNQKEIAPILASKLSYILYTNDLFVWGNDDVWWNDKKDKCQAYILKEVDGKWKEINIQDLTEKEIRQAHDIVRMYMAGAFYKEI